LIEGSGGDGYLNGGREYASSNGGGELIEGSGGDPSRRYDEYSDGRREYASSSGGGEFIEGSGGVRPRGFIKVFSSLVLRDLGFDLPRDGVSVGKCVR
jgi:hypothetical protein